MLSSYRGSGAVPTVADDSYTNRVSLTADTTTLDAVDAPGGVTTVQVADDSEATLRSDTVRLDKQTQPASGVLRSRVPPPRPGTPTPAR